MQLSLRITPRVLCEIQTLSGYDQGPVTAGAPKLCAGAIAGEDTCQVVYVEKNVTFYIAISLRFGLAVSPVAYRTVISLQETTIFV